MKIEKLIGLGVGAFAALIVALSSFYIFIGLKLTGYITWSWWIVLMPLYGGFALFFVVTLIALGALGAKGWRR